MALPKRAGVHTRKELHQPKERIELQTIYVQNSLMELTQEYALFTHGLMFTHGHWMRDVINDFLLETHTAYPPAVINLTRKVFTGMDFRENNRRLNQDWDFRLLACPYKSWADLFQFLSTVGGINRDEHKYHVLLCQQIPVPDVVALEHFTELPKRGCPTVNVFAFGINGNDKTVYFEPAKNPPIDKPKVRVGPPEQEVIDMAERVFAGHPQPFMVRDIKLAKAQVAEAMDMIQPMPQILIGDD